MTSTGPTTVLRWTVADRSIELDTATGRIMLFGLGQLDAEQAREFARALEAAAREAERQQEHLQ